MSELSEVLKAELIRSTQTIAALADLDEEDVVLAFLGGLLELLVSAGNNPPEKCFEDVKKYINTFDGAVKEKQAELEASLADEEEGDEDNG